MTVLITEGIIRTIDPQTNCAFVEHEIFDKYNMGIYVVTVKLQDVNPPESVKPSFNEVNEAKQEQEKMINEAEQAYNGYSQASLSLFDSHKLSILKKNQLTSQRNCHCLRYI